MHTEYKRIAENADKAILFIHGIVGTPNHFRDFLPLVPDNVSIYNMRLDGHGKGVKDFAAASMKKWEEQVGCVITELSSTHKEIYIVAHSMGTLFALEQAIQNPKVTKLFLLAVPLRLFLKPRLFINSMKVYWNRIDPNDPIASAAKNCYGIAADKNPFHYIGWIPRFLELFGKIRKVRKKIKELTTPCFVYQSAKDEMVAKEAQKFLGENPFVTVHVLEKSGHYYYECGDFAFLKSELTKFVS